MRYAEPPDTLAAMDRDEARTRDRADFAARRCWCSVCHTTGGHAPGCPETDDDIDDQEESLCND